MKFFISESQECDVLCAWANLHPWGEYLISIPNQALCFTNPGIRKKLSRQNVKKGIPDYFLAIPKKGYGGCWIEMKRKNLKGKNLRPEQQLWKDKLNAMGYRAIVVYGAEEAIEEIKKYLND